MRFISIEGTNYFVRTKNRSTKDIYYDIIKRMGVIHITPQLKRKIMHEIRKQTNEEST